MKKLEKKIFFALLFFVIVSFKAEVLLAVDKYKVVDGDSLEQGDVRIRLADIDAPELFQKCYDENNKSYECGKIATDKLKRFVADVAYCKETGVDRYKRRLMECFGENGMSINQNMVLNGWAVSYGKRFEDDEKGAKKQKAGFWKGRFMRPELYRALHKN
jgi:endonuclease YncB( thermonuclease family)